MALKTISRGIRGAVFIREKAPRKRGISMDQTIPLRLYSFAYFLKRKCSVSKVGTNLLVDI